MVHALSSDKVCCVCQCVLTIQFPPPTTICLVSANDTGCIKGTEEADGGRGGGGCTGGGVQVVVLALMAKLLWLKLKCLSR